LGTGNNLRHGQPTGFLDYVRELPLDRSAKKRIADWNEFHEHMDEKKLRDQGARCNGLRAFRSATPHAGQRHGQRLPGQQL